jgi:Zn-finger nucleic acid-binding protein
MEKPVCSCSPHTQFDRYEPVEGLFAQRCPKCLAIVLAMKDYLPWIERHYSDRSISVQPSPLAGREMPSKARLCPSCQRLMARYRTGDADSFWLDFCPACGLVRFDAGEWEQLAQSGLMPYLDIILTERWQKNIQSHRASSLQNDILCQRFGEATFSEIQRVKDWLSSQPNKQDILAYLSTSLSNPTGK